MKSRGSSVRKKKGQVTLFALLAVSLLAVMVVLLLLQHGGHLTLFLKQTPQPVPQYVEECMRFLIVDGVVILNEQGGFIYNYTPNMTTTQRVFAYSIYNGVDTRPSWEFMQRELSRYIEDNIDTCLDESTLLFDRLGVPNVRTVIYPERVYAEMEYPITTQIGDTVQVYNEYASFHQIPLGRMLELRDDIIDDMLEYPNLMILDKLYDTDFEMIINPYSGNTKVIEVINRSHRLRNDPLVFWFAVRDIHYLPPLLVFTRTIPDMAVNVGVPVVVQARCNHPCRFYDDTILFDIDERTGVIEYTPDPLDVGEYDITITITDDTYTVQDTFKMVVLP